MLESLQLRSNKCFDCSLQTQFCLIKIFYGFDVHDDDGDDDDDVVDIA